MLLQISDVGRIIDEGAKVNGSSDGYTFALIVLIVCCSVLLVTIRMLWVRLNKKEDDINEMTKDNIALLTEVNMHMSKNNQLGEKIDSLENMVIQLNTKIDGLNKILE